MELKKYWRILVRRKFLFFSVFGGVILVSLLLGFLSTPIYKASSKVLVKNNDTNTAVVSSLPNNVGKINYIESTNALGNMQALIENENSINKVINDLNLSIKKRPYAYKAFLNPGGMSLLMNKRGVKVEQIDNTEIFRITGYSPDPKEAENISNTVVLYFQRLNKKINREDVSRLVSILQRQTKNIKDSIAFFENIVKEYQTKHEAIAIETKSTELVTQLISLESSLAKMVSEKEAAHPDVVATLRQITAMRNDLLKIPEIQINYTTTRRIADSMVSVYQSLLGDLEKAKVLRAMNMANVSVLERAQITPLHKKYSIHFPRKKLLLLVGILLGGTMGIFIVFFREYLDDTIKEPEEVQDFLDQHLLGIIPITRQPLAMQPFSPQFLGKTATIVMGIKFIAKGTLPKSFTVTSYGRGEGKTFFSSALGYVTAESGKKTLLVDLNTADGQGVHNYFDIPPPECGFFDCIRYNKSIEDTVKKLRGDNLFLLSGGKNLSGGIGMSVNSSKIQEFFTTLQSKFDLIIYDTPSFSEGLDYLLAAYGLNNIITIVEANRFSGELIRSETISLRSKGITSLGIVLNKYPSKT